ncbi:MAG: enoyl-CoA hydratase/isomerase family protein [Acidimicrobiia bacterium]|nr:enoyl-CoA hydratase/isomerase family protein [Acidimicrobiia bacterium]
MAEGDGGSTPTLEIRDGRATITLRRPDKRNRIEPRDLEAMIVHLDAIEADPNVRVVVIAAEGPSWCAGYHLGALAEGERSKVSFGEMCDRIEAVRVPTVAALGGNVHGGGTDLAVSCDLRVGAAGISLGMPAARIGLQYYASGLRRFVARIGPDATKRLFLTGETIPAEELLRIGYLAEVVPAADFAARIDSLCAAVAGLAPLAVQLTKAAINELSGPAPDLTTIEANSVRTARSHDHREAMVAMKEKRPPRFEGR